MAGPGSGDWSGTHSWEPFSGDRCPQTHPAPRRAAAAKATHSDVVGVDVVSVLLALCPAQADAALGIWEVKISRGQRSKGDRLTLAPTGSEEVSPRTCHSESGLAGGHRPTKLLRVQTIGAAEGL